MSTTLFSRYAAAIRNFNGDASAAPLQIASDGVLSVYYAPFDWINPSARVVLVGITPGRTQAVNALSEAKRQLASGATPEQALMRAKQTGGFSGAMRPNLTAMLDRIGLASWLRITSCEALFGESSKLLQTASVLPFPVFVNGENYNGSPDIVSTPLLRGMMVEHFVPLLKSLPDAVFLPLGPVPAKAMSWLVSQGHVQAGRVLQGMPHPSGANAERIQYFLGRKEASRLSAKTDPAKLDAARAALMNAVAALRFCSKRLLRFYVFLQEGAAPIRLTSKSLPVFQTAQATRSSLRARMTKAWGGLEAAVLRAAVLPWMQAHRGGLGDILPDEAIELLVLVCERQDSACSFRRRYMGARGHDRSIVDMTIKTAAQARLAGGHVLHRASRRLPTAAERRRSLRRGSS